MTDSNMFFIATKEDNAELASGVDREHYKWYQNYIYPIPTLFNAKQGDGQRSLDASEETSDKPMEYAHTLLTPEQYDALEAVAAEHGEDARLNPEKYLQGHELFQTESEAGTRGLFSYDPITGVPSQERPPLFSYIVPRGAFVASSAGVRASLLKANKPLQTPADYHAQYEAFLKDSQSIFLVGRKVMGFGNLNEIYTSDSIFGWQRLAGTNPRVLMALTSDRLTALLAKMPLTDAHIAAIAGPGATLRSEIEKNRLYYCDYWLLDNLPLQEGRHMPAAIGVFWSDAGSQQLLPVAIQLGQTPGRIRTPGEADWDLAKLLFAVADFNYHEMGTHLCEAHFAQEAFIIATRRNLPTGHPIGALFLQIYWVLLYNNALGRMALVNPGGYVDKMMAGDLKTGSLRIVGDYYTKVWSWDHWNLDTYLAKQGTTDTQALPVYPYRDDGLPLWGAIKAFAAEYVNAYYAQASDVAGDPALEAWVGELIDPQKGNLASKGFPTSVTTKADLAEVVARLVWQAGPGHGSINYSQWQHFAVIPNAPGAAYATEGTIMAALPPIDQAVLQGDIINTLTQDVFGRIGKYDDSFTSKLNRSAKNAVENFQRALEGCAKSVDERNASYPRALLEYPFLHPNNVPNSTNI